MQQLSLDDLENLKFGCAVLGSGGGGDPTYPFLMVKYQLERYGCPQLISIEELQPDDLVVPLSMMGAPLITLERLPSERELDELLKTVEKRLGQKPTVLMAAEIGGANAFTPFLIAAKWSIPVLDADMIGRAFPELQMSTCYLKGLQPTPAVMADCLGNTVVIETSDAAKLESIARQITVAMGSSAAVGFYLMQGREVQGAVISGSVSKALSLGKVLRSAWAKGDDSISALLTATQGRVIARGALIDMKQSVEKGFLQGSVTILSENQKIELLYQNEYLFASCGSTTLSATPNLLVLLDATNGTCISSECLRYGLQVVLIEIPAPDVWRTPEGLALVGPEIFGYNRMEAKE